jgi:archaellin
MKKGEIGLGILIIFLAIIVIAAIVSSVLILSGAGIQEKTLETGSSVHENIGTLIRIIQITAEDGSLNTLQNFSIIMKTMSGTAPLKLNQTIITFDTLNTTTILTYKESTPDDFGSTLIRGNYTVRYLEEGPIHHRGVLQKGDIIEVFLQAPYPIQEDEKIRISILPKESPQVITEFTTPDVISMKKIDLYP